MYEFSGYRETLFSNKFKQKGKASRVSIQHGSEYMKYKKINILFPMNEKKI